MAKMNATLRVQRCAPEEVLWHRALLPARLQRGVDRLRWMKCCLLAPLALFPVAALAVAARGPDSVTAGTAKA